MKTQVLILFAFVFVVGCKCNKVDQKNSKMDNTESVLIAKGNLHGAGSEGFTKENRVIDNQSDWDNLIAQMNSVNTVSDRFTETKIDFSNYTIIAIFNAVKGSGGHSINVDVTSTSTNTVVNVTFASPSGNATSVMTQPYYITKIEKRDLPIIFK
ncbi:protease complex subunit PrcB family protein [Winogradskyella sp. F6397]|uniref:Protease complex subunit PrcB family protein n=1 Tax=Winogradskyella marina TaxID=2785530 RepID=A0ABS0EI40_9FLAO|nr:MULTISPECIES: protease complex subunit PrcB family protein [Winogradskyella]MBF8149836.1 protease complex subunit PrcB family protein [Winogradskyella marina]